MWKSRIGIAASISLASLANIAFPSQAESFSQVEIQQTHVSQHNQFERSSIVPGNTAIVAQTINTVELDLAQTKTAPITMFTIQPVIGVGGEVLVPEQSIIKAQLVPHASGSRIVAKAIVVNGQLMPINAMSDVLQTVKINSQDPNAKAKQQSAVFKRLGANLGGVIGRGNTNSIFIGALGGGAIGIVRGLGRSSSQEIVHVAEGSVHVLSLGSEMLLSDIP